MKRAGARAILVASSVLLVVSTVALVVLLIVTRASFAYYCDWSSPCGGVIVTSVALAAPLLGVGVAAVLLSTALRRLTPFTSRLDLLGFVLGLLVLVTGVAHFATTLVVVTTNYGTAQPPSGALSLNGLYGAASTIEIALIAAWSAVATVQLARLRAPRVAILMGGLVALLACVLASPLGTNALVGGALLVVITVWAICLMATAGHLPGISYLHRPPTKTT